MTDKSSNPSTGVLIDVKNVSKCYHLYDRPQDRLLQSLFGARRKFYRDFWALKDVSLQVNRGEAVGIIGRNGAGKSTLLRLITGTIPPTSGDVRARGRVAALLQLGSGFNPEFTGRENVYLNGAILGFSRAEIGRRFEEIAAFADIGEFIEQPVKTYSSGMTVRLAFAVSACLEPEVLIIDEALSVGDAVFQFKCRSRLESLIVAGTTLLFVSHDMAAIKSFCSRVIYLKDGMIRAEGSPEDLAELYFMDVRAEQAEQLAREGRNDKGTMVGDKVAGGWGSDKGEIVRFCFCSTRTANAVFRRNEVIEVEVVAQVAEDLNCPYLSVLIQTQALLNLGGKRVSLESIGKHNNRLIRAKFSIEPMFSRGRYFVTLRLEEKRGYEQYFPIHKIAGALNFEVAVDEESDFGNCLDIGMTAEVHPEAANGNFS